MRKEVLTILTFMLCAGITCAQRLKPNSTIKANKVTFVTKGFENDRMSVVNNKNLYYNRTPKSRNPDISFEVSDKFALIKAFREVFNDDRIEQLMPERNILMTFYVSPMGRILEVSFLLSKKTLLSAQELEDLEKAIRTNVSIKFRPEDIKGQDFFDITWNVPYKKVLDGTLK